MGPWYAWRGGVFPIDWEVEFGSAGPLHFEIGFGDGRYTVRRAAASPSERFVGVERSGASLYRAIKRVRRAGLDNIRLLAGSAEFAARHLFARGALETITVNFPDPWPKERHRRNRLLKRSFFDLAATRLRQGGRILLATDHKDYLEGAVAEARSSDLFRVIELGPAASCVRDEVRAQMEITRENHSTTAPSNTMVAQRSCPIPFWKGRKLCLTPS